MIVGSRLPVPSRVEITFYKPTSRERSGYAENVVCCPRTLEAGSYSHAIADSQFGVVTPVRIDVRVRQTDQRLDRPQHKDLATIRVGRCRLITEKALREWLERKTESSC